MRSVYLLLFMLLTVSGSAQAVIDVYEFENESQRQQYQSLTKILRCPKCQNQDIADSNSPIASDMRREVHRLVREGKTEEEVVDFMVERFDEFVTYKPKVSASTYALWYGPWLLVAIGLVIVVLLVRSRRSGGTAADTAEVSLNAEQRARLAAFIAQHQAHSQNNHPNENLIQNKDKSGDPKP